MKHISNMSFKWINTVYNSDRRETTVVQTVKNPPALCETWVRSLGWEDPLEEGMATHSSILACRSPVDRGAWQATVHGAAKNQTRLNNKAMETSSTLENYLLSQSGV